MSNYKNFLIIYVILCIVGAVIALYCGYSASQQTTIVVFCDVGQGDGIYIRTKDHVDIVIDAGPDEKMLDCLKKNMPFFDTHIEFVFISHLHADHYDGFQHVGEQYTYGDVLITQGSPKSTTLIKSILKPRFSKTRVINEKDIISVNERTFFKVFWPSEDLREQSDQNSYSHIMLFEDDGFSIVFTGDAQPDGLSYAKNEIRSYLNKHNINVEIVKVPHHGSINGLTKDFLISINPLITIISSGKGNIYGHPSKRILGMISDEKIPNYNTADTSTIKTYIRDHHLTVEFLGERYLFEVF